MRTSPVSFGKVIAVTGNRKKIKKLENKLSNPRDCALTHKDVTDVYKDAPIGGALTEAANQGKKVHMYITGSDMHKYLQSATGWENTDAALSHLSEYYSVDTTSVNEVAKRILDQER